MSSKIQIRKVCQYCGRSFLAHTTMTRFCSHLCAQRNYKMQKREARLAKTSPNSKPFVSKSPTNLEREYLSCDAVARMMGLHRTTVYRYCVTGQLNCIKMNRKIFIRKSDLELLFEHHAPYVVTHTERKSKQFSKQKAESHVVNTPQKSAIVSTSPPSDGDWYTASEVCDKYDMTRTAVYSLVYEYGVPKVKSGNATYYAKSVIDTLLSCRKPDSSITEWYSMEDIKRLYGLEQGYVSNLIYKNPIPKMRRGNKGYYSKEHFDALMAAKFPRPEYYTTEEAMAKFGIGRDSLYHHIKRNGIHTIREGRYIKIPKAEIDQLFKTLNKE